MPSFPCDSSSETKHRVELKPRRRPVERAGRGRAERAEQTVGALVDDRGEGERDARVGGVSRDEAVHAHVRRLEEVGEVEGREDRVLLDAQEGVVEQKIAALARLAELQLSPVAAALAV